ncbi:MAG: hypothetical protein ABR600_06050 [Actinomycetota bacterium]
MVRRKRRAVRHDLPTAAFLDVLGSVEEAKAALVAVVPSPRGAGPPVAEGVHGFEVGLRHALDAMPGWRHPELEAEWTACEQAIGEALRRTEGFRLRAPELGYESLLAEIGELIDPLEPFEHAAERLRALGSRLR